MYTSIRFMRERRMLGCRFSVSEGAVHDTGRMHRSLHAGNATQAYAELAEDGVEISDLSIRSSTRRPAAQAQPHQAPIFSRNDEDGRSSGKGLHATAAVRAGHEGAFGRGSSFQRCHEATAEARAKGQGAPTDGGDAGQEAAWPTVQGMAWGARAGHLSHVRDLQIDTSSSLRQRGARRCRNSSGISAVLEASAVSVGGPGMDGGEAKGGRGSGGGGVPVADAREARGSVAASMLSGVMRMSTLDSVQLQVGLVGAGVVGGDGGTARSTSDSVPSLARLGLSNASERLKRLKTQRERSARITRQLKDANWKQKPIEVVGGGVQAVPSHRDRRVG